MSLPPGFLDELRTRVSLAAVAGRKLTWDRTKTNAARGDYWAPCPFHQEKTASFHVKEREGFYYCFGCQAKGDAISFVRELENLGFMEAVESLAQEAGMTMPARDPAAAARDAARKGLAEVMEQCVQHYRLQLRTAGAQEARDYLDGRGLKDAALKRFEIGFAPDARRGLAEAMAQKGVPEDDLVRAGMLIAPDDGGKPYDRFRGRIMFPIRDPRGRCISFGGRALSAEARAKYLNGPETELFDKGRSLFNHGPAREAAGKAGRLIVAEGYMDVIALASAGFDESVAPLGTAVTEDQLDLLWRMADEPVVALDGDAAGLRAAQRLAALALPKIGPGRSLQFCLMPQGQDPDDLVRAGGAEAMEAALAQSLPLVEMLWRKVSEGRDVSSPERRAGLDKELRELLRQIPDPGLRRHYGEAMKERRDALFRPVRAETRRGDPRTGPRSGPGFAPGGRRFGQGRRGAGGFGQGFGGGFGFAEAPMPETRRTRLADPAGAGEARGRECALIWGMLHHPQIAERHESTLAELEFRNPDLAELRARLLACLPDALEAEDPCAALRAALAAEGETGAGEAESAAPGVSLLDRLAAEGVLHRALGPSASPEQAAAALVEVMDRHAMQSASRAEGKAAMSEISLETADEITHRLAYITREREEAARRPAGAETASADGEDELSARLRDFIGKEPWVKRPRRR